MHRGLLTDERREWMFEEIRLLSRSYGIESWERQKRGDTALESMDDTRLSEHYAMVQHGVQLCREGIGFDEAGLM